MTLVPLRSAQKAFKNLTCRSGLTPSLGVKLIPVRVCSKAHIRPHRAKTVSARCYSSTSNGNSVFKSAEEIKVFINTSVAESWDPMQFCEPVGLHPEITEDQLDNLLTLSGFNPPQTDVEKHALLETLNQQVRFLSHLHSAPVRQDPESGLSDVEISRDARLLDQHTKALSYEELMQQDDIALTSPGPGSGGEKNLYELRKSKGEIAESWNPTKMAKLHEDQFYVIKEKAPSGDNS